MATAKNALVPVKLEQYAVMEHGIDTVLDIMQENCSDGISINNLERIKMPSGGGASWETVSLDGEVENIPTIEGVIIHKMRQRVYWKESFDETGGGVPPDCASKDARIGQGNPGGVCSQCPLSQYGSARKGDKDLRGQACQERVILFVLRPGSLLPTIISAPPTSLKEVDSYMVRLAGAAKPFYGVITLFSLVKEKNKDGIAYAKIQPKLGQALSREEVAKIKPLKDIIAAAAGIVIVDDYSEVKPGDGAGGNGSSDAERGEEVVTDDGEIVMKGDMRL